MDDSRKANSILDFLNYLIDINEIYLYAKDLYQPKYQLLIKKRQQTAINYLKDPKGFIEYLFDIKDIYTNIDD